MDGSGRRTGSPARAILLLLAGAFLLGDGLTSPGFAAGKASPKPVSIRRVGGANSIVHSPLVTRADLQAFSVEHRDEIEKILALAAWPGEPGDLLAAVREGRIEEMELPVDGHLTWMSGRRGGKKLVVTRNIMWKGKQPLPSFVIRFVSKESRWAFLVPKACGNLSLYSQMGTSEIKVSVPSGDLRLNDPEGRPITIAPDRTLTVSSPGSPDEKIESPAAKSDLPTELAVSEGTVEFHDYKLPVSVLVPRGNSVTRVVRDDGRVELNVSEGNPQPTKIRIGDATGTVAAGTVIGAGWSLPECRLEVRVSKDCVPATFEIDASRSFSNSGKIVSVEVSVEFPNGEKVLLTKPDSPEAFRWSRHVYLPGRYRFSAVAISDRPNRSENECRFERELAACPPPPPTTDAEISATRIDEGSRVRFDGSKSRSDGGKIEKISVEIDSDAGAPVRTVELKAPFADDIRFPVAGTYRLRAVATDNFGQKSPAVWEKKVTVETRDEVTAAAFAGRGSHVDDDSGKRNGWVQGVEMDIRRRVGGGTSVGLGLGVALNKAGRGVDFFSDVKVAWRREAATFGLGYGVWKMAGTYGPNLSLNAGLDLPWQPRGVGAVQVYGEGRLFMREMLKGANVGDHYIALVGVRIGLSGASPEKR